MAAPVHGAVRGSPGALVSGLYDTYIDVTYSSLCMRVAVNKCPAAFPHTLHGAWQGWT